MSRAIFAIDNKNFCYYKKYFVDISFTGLYTVNATELQSHQKIFLCDMYNTGTVAVSARTARRKPQRPHHGSLCRLRVSAAHCGGPRRNQKVFFNESREVREVNENKETKAAAQDSEFSLSRRPGERTQELHKPDDNLDGLRLCHRLDDGGRDPWPSGSTSSTSSMPRLSATCSSASSPSR